jgi:hypothetical protein
MSERLRFYVAHSSGLEVMDRRSGSMNTIARHFEGRTPECVVGSRTHPEVVYAGIAFDGGYRTRDGGLNWEKLLEGDVRCFAVDPHDERVVYAGLGPVQLLRSEDGGSSWEPLDGLQRLPEDVKTKWCAPGAFHGKIPPHVRNIFIHPDDTDLLLVPLEHGGVVRSEDRGETWEDASSGIPYLDMHLLGNYPGDKDRYYVSCARGFFRTDDRGRSWHRVEDGMPWAYTEKHSYSHDWLFLPGDPLRMLVCGADGSPGVWWEEKRAPHGVLLLSDDTGEHWYKASEGLPSEMLWMPWVLVPHPTDSGTVFAGMGDTARGFGFDPSVAGTGSMYVTRDRGNSWEPVIAQGPSILTAWVAPD